MSRGGNVEGSLRGGGFRPRRRPALLISLSVAARPPGLVRWPGVARPAAPAWLPTVARLPGLSWRASQG